MDEMGVTWDEHECDIGTFPPTIEGFEKIKSHGIPDCFLVDLMIYEIEMHQLWLTFRHDPMSIVLDYLQPFFCQYGVARLVESFTVKNYYRSVFLHDPDPYLKKR